MLILAGGPVDLKNLNGLADFWVGFEKVDGGWGLAQENVPTCSPTSCLANQWFRPLQALKEVVRM